MIGEGGAAMNTPADGRHVFKYSLQIQEALERAGWHLGRRCHKWAEKKKRHLEHEGFTVFPEVLKVLEEFGELTIGEHGAGEDTEKSVVTMDPEPALTASELFIEYRVLTKKNLCPVGIIGEEDYLGMDISGQVYYVGDWVWYLGDNFAHALETLLLGKKYPPQKAA